MYWLDILKYAFTQHAGSAPQVIVHKSVFEAHPIELQQVFSGHLVKMKVAAIR